MLPRENAAQPFPPGFTFPDVDDQVLAHEDEWSQPQVQAGAWNATMWKILSRDQAASRAA